MIGSLYITKTRVSCHASIKMCTHTKFKVQKTKKGFSSIALDHAHEPVNAGFKGEREL